ncbi:MAG: SpaH/EbpB family LPXTG-anchored major pilin [Varibaculum cambriense]|uniref:SpaH/EbpB family LPXTG-anchored major pilin n=1 Tax=Varibaculum cambriense TaxID=184870 RepID=UPI00241C535A|nr:SpaH/EbpB family LPXTG-anchored major pilin [Varibaculum cambriense]MBS6752959.1 SpaH/EbpB family LPXTG-anchored major pilin [Varibaculum cambriense]
MSKKKLLAVLTGMVMAFMGLAGVGAASADTILGTSQPEKASLTVHKYLGATTNLKHDGTAIDAGELTGKTPLEGVNFKLYQVEGVDVSTNDGLKLAQEIAAVSLKDDVVTTGITVGATTYKLAATPTTKTTGANGEAKFADVERGLYVVVEDLEGSTKIMNGSEEVVKEKITPIAPFAVTLPMTNPDGTAWNSDVHVYPKNQENTLDKKVVDKGVTTLPEGVTGTANEFKYVLSTKSTGADANGDGKMNAADLGGIYKIVDQLPANVEYVKTTAKIAGADTTDFDATTKSEGDPARTTVTVAFKGAGLDTIAAGTDIEVTLHVKLKSVPADGLTKNTGQLFPNKYSEDNGKPVVSPEVVTKHGDIVIKKVDKDGAALAGAVFTVHLADAATKSCSDLTKLGPVIKTSEATGADGLVKITDLQLTNWIDGAVVAEGDQVPYCLVEKTAPKGYQLLPQAIEFKLTKAGTVVDLNTAKAGDGSFVQVTNYKNPGLPLTGAQGILLVSVLGLILVSVGVVLTVKRRQD